MPEQPASTKTVGERIRHLRKSKRLAQKQLAQMIGVSHGALTNFEKGRRRISIDWLQKIADALNTPLAYFLDESRTTSGITPGDPRERRLVVAWRKLGKDPVLQQDFLRLIEHMPRRRRS